MSLAERLNSALSRPDYALATLPQSTQRVLRELQAEGTADSVARAIEKDPSLAARVMRLANSAFYKGNNQAKTISQGVVRVGMRTVQNLVIAESQRPLHQGTHLRATEYLTRLWRHAVAAAVAAQDIAQRARQIDPAVAFLAGLLHDVGKVALLPYVPPPKKPEDSWPTEVELESAHANAGQTLLARWNIPAEICTAVSRHHLPKLTGPHHRLTAAVGLANGLCHALGIEAEPDPKAAEEAAAWAQVLGLGEADLATLTATLRGRVAEMESILGS